MQYQVTFNYLNSEDQEYQITAKIIPGGYAPVRNFDRFQEPEDQEEIEIIKVLAIDDDGAGHEVSEAVFTDSEIEAIEIKASEEFHNQGKDEEDYPDFF